MLKNKKQHIICNGFTDYNENCIGFNGNRTGACWSLLIIGRLKNNNNKTTKFECNMSQNTLQETIISLF